MGVRQRVSAGDFAGAHCGRGRQRRRQSGCSAGADGARRQRAAQHVAQLQSLEVDVITPQRYLLLAARDDEVLDYRMAVARYRDARQIVIDGGDHGLSNFADYVGTVLDFCGSTETD